MGHNNKTIAHIFTYLHDAHGKIIDNDLLDNKEKMDQDWDSETPIQHFYKQIEHGARFAALGDIVMPEKEKIAIGYKLIHQTGELTTAHRD